MYQQDNLSEFYLLIINKNLLDNHFNYLILHNKMFRLVN